MSSIKYPRTRHLPWSLGVTSDDKMCPDTNQFEGKTVVVTEKMDGENTTMYSDHIHARSLDSKGGIDRDWVKSFWANIFHQIPEGWRICGENLWAKHSIHYTELKSYFYGFSVWDHNNTCLKWDDTLYIFDVLGIIPVPTLYRGIWNEQLVKTLANELDTEKIEGYVVRLDSTFCYDDFGSSVAKFVRENHIQTDKHWRNSQLVCNVCQ